MGAKKFYDEIFERFPHTSTVDGCRALLQLGREHEDALATREPNLHDAEACRLLMLAAAQVPDYSVARLWRTRSMARCAAIGWTEGVGSLLMGEAFIELDRANDGYARGRTLDVLRPSELALQIFDEVRRFAIGPRTDHHLDPRSPTETIERMFHEKRGFLLLVAERFDESLDAYAEAALVVEAHARGKVKVELGRILALYLRDSPSDATSLLAESTLALGAEARGTGQTDLALTAARNAEVMLAGSPAVTPYEIL